MKKFVIIGIQRTGTTVIRRALNSHADIECYPELFKMRHFRTKPSKHRLAYHRLMLSTNLNLIRHFFDREKLVKKTLDNIYLTSSDGNIGFKLMCNQAKMFPTIVSYIKNNNIKIIHIVRKNLLKTFVSRKLAVKRGYNSRVPIEQTKIAINTNGLISALKKIQAENDFWESKFSNNDDILRLTYESYLENSKMVQAKLCEFMGVKLQVLDEHYVKMTSDKLREVIINYQAVVNSLLGTEFEVFLDDELTNNSKQ